MDTGKFPYQVSTLYQSLRLEQEEINKLKWIESEKAGYDIGMDRAIIIWITRYKQKWKQEISQSGIF